MYSHVATAGLAAAAPAAIAATGISTPEVAVIVGGAGAGVVGLVALLRAAHAGVLPWMRK
jgi:hypothetical protein